MHNEAFIYATIALIIVVIIRRLFLHGSTLIYKTTPQIGISGYDIIYTDQKEKNKKEGVTYSKILHSEKYSLAGKPDYIFKKKRGVKLIPVELKSGSVGKRDEPNAGDLMQLVTYFLIIDEVYGVKPHEGRIIYSDAMFIVKNVPELRNKLIKTTERMRDMLKTGDEDVSPSFVKCRHCACRDTVCEYCDNDA